MNFDPVDMLSEAQCRGFVRAWGIAETLRAKGLNAYLSLSLEGLPGDVKYPCWHCWPRGSTSGGVGLYYKGAAGLSSVPLLLLPTSPLFAALEALPSSPSPDAVWEVLERASDPGCP